VHSTPPGRTETVQARQVLVIAPHHDDEVLGCGGLIAQLASSGAVVRVGFLTGGGDQHGREAESRDACRVLGVASAMHLSLTDGALIEPDATDAVANGIAGWMRAGMPDLLLAPSPTEISDDHRAAFRGLHAAMQSLRQDHALGLRALTVLLYEVNHASHPNLLVDVSTQAGIIEFAMGCHVSQQAAHDYLGAAVGLRRFRTLTLPPGVTHAEAYRRLSGWDLATQSLAQVAADTGARPYAPVFGARPLVSVVVRTRNRPALLADALTSIASSDYRQVEVILVNDGGAEPPVPDDFPFPIHRVTHTAKQGRAAAAQAGVDASTGHYISFLDDDDLMAPDHLSTLVGIAATSQSRVVYTLAAVTDNELDPARGWVAISRDVPYGREFDRDRLLVDNYIPINTLLIERAALHEAGSFDRALEIFEDWDMLIRLAAITPFRHHPRVTCEYRHFRGSVDHALGRHGAYRADFVAMKARVLAKHAGSLDPATLARAIVGLTTDIVAAGERARIAEGHTDRQIADAARLGHQLAAALHDTGRLADEVTRLQGEERRLTSALRDAHVDLGRVTSASQAAANEMTRLTAELVRAHAEIGRLTAEAVQRHAEFERVTAETMLTHAEIGRLTGELSASHEELDRTRAELGRVYGEEARLSVASHDLQEALDRIRPRKLSPPSRAARPPARRASVLIVSWNGRAHLETSLAALFAQQPAGLPLDIWVFDNGSSDDTAAWLRKYHPAVHLVSSDSNLGFCAGNNRLAAATDADLLLFLNNDTAPEPNWAGELIEAMAGAAPDVAAAAGVLVDWTGERLDFGRGAMTFDGHAFQIDSRRPLAEIALPAHGEEQLFGCGANLIVRRDSFLAAGGFDEHFFAYYDDVDLGWRLWSGGERVISAPRAVVRHRGASTGRTLASANRAFLVERNAFLTAYKNYDASCWDKLMPAMMLTLVSRTAAMMVGHNPNGHALGADPFHGNGNGHRARSLSDRIMGRLRTDQPVLTDAGTIAQVRALSWLSRNMDAAAERRAAVQARRCRSDDDIFARFPLHLVPTYPGDDALFASAGFRAWLPEEPRLTFRRLDEIMAHP
jgi:GT2 family glycosyltransferase/LmbE family N-acetylglucosaminyl deacetylase